MSRSIFSLFLMLALWGGVGREAAAQLNVRVMIPARNQMPAEVSEWLDNPALIQVTIQNTTGATFEELRFSFHVDGAARGRVVSSKDLHPVQPRFRLGPFETRVFMARDLIDEEALAFAAGLEDEVVRAGIPEDHYVLCATVIDVGLRRLGNEACTPFLVLEPDPPMLVYPTDATVDARTLRFQWSPVATPGVQYRLVVKPRFQGQDAVTAMQGNPVLIERTLAVPSYTYLPSDPSFDLYPNSAGYVWQVQSQKDGRAFGKQEGKSPVGTFRLEAPVEESTVATRAPLPAAPLGEGAETEVTFRLSRAPGGTSYALPSLGGFAPTTPVTRSGARPDARTVYELRVWRVQDGSTAAAAKAGAPEWQATAAAPRPDDLFGRALLGADGQPLTFRGRKGRTYVWNVTKTETRRGGGVGEGWTTDDAVFTVGRPGDDALANADPSTWAPKEQGTCGSGCTVPKPTNTELFDGAAEDLKDKNVQLGAFVLRIEKAEGDGGSLRGTGIVKVPFMKAALRVAFTDLAVNTDGQVLRGTAKAVADGQLIPEAWLGDFTQPFKSGDRSIIERVREYVRAGRRLNNALDGNTPVGLPVGLAGAAIGIDAVHVNVVAAEFRADGARVNVTAGFPLPMVGGSIALGSKGICLLPGGFAQQEFNLSLLEDYAFNVGGVTTRLLESRDGGTSARVNCNGFQDLRLAMEQEYPRSWLVSVDNRGKPRNEPVTARFRGTFTSARGWLLSGSMPRAGLASAPGFWFDAPTVFLDWSHAANQGGMQFPEGYAGDRSDAWTGLYVPALKLHLPPEMKSYPSGRSRNGLEADVRGLLVDRSGVSVSADVRNLLDLNNNPGDLGGWSYSLNRLQLRVVSNSVQKADLDGLVKVPVARDPLRYAGKYTAYGNSYYLNLTLENTGTVTADLLSARLTLNPNSLLYVYTDDGGLGAAALLHGSLSFTETPDGVPMALGGLTFNNVGIKSAGPNYVYNGGQWGVSGWGQVMNMPAWVRNVRLEARDLNGCTQQVGVAADLGIVLPPGNVFKADATLYVNGNIYCSNGQQPYRYGFTDAGFGALRVSGDFGGFLRVYNSAIDFFKNDRTWGDGFAGNVSVGLMGGQYGMTAAARFGQVTQNSRPINYGTVDLLVRSSYPLAALGPVTFHGVGGGFSYNLRRLNELPDPATMAKSSTRSANDYPRYQVAEGYKSFRLSTTLGIMGVLNAFNADATVEAEFGYWNNLSRLSLSAPMWAMGQGVDGRQDAAVTGYLDASYDFSYNRFSGWAWAKTSSQAQSLYAMSASGWMQFYGARDGWYVYLGKPTDPIGATFRAAGTTFRAGAYLMMGSILPPMPPTPGDAPAGYRDFDTAWMTGAGGYVLGARLDFDAKGAFGGIEAELSARAGIDLGLYNYGIKSITGSKGRLYRPGGASGWYSYGRVYTTLSGHIDVSTGWGKARLAEASATAVLTGGFPNPSFANGAVYGYYRILGGSHKTYFQHDVTVGDPPKRYNY